MSEALLTLDPAAEAWADWPEDDGVERTIIQGEVIEEKMSERNPHHSRLNTRFARFLDLWLDTPGRFGYSS